MRKWQKLTAAICMAIYAIGGGAATAMANDFPAGSKMAELSAAGKIKIGVLAQYPLIGMRNFTGYEGFDIEVAKLLAAKLGLSKDNVEFLPVTTPTREPFLQQGLVDIVIAGYTITPKRSEVIDFAGPYLPSPSGIMVPNGNPLNIKSMEDLVGKKLCAPTGSSQEAYIGEHFPEVHKTLVLFDSSAKCAQAIMNGQVDASTTDTAILAALSKQNDGHLQVVNFSYGSAPWGIGIKKSEDKVFCKWINQTVAELFKDGSWAKAYNDTLGTVVPGGAPEPPKLGASCPISG